MARKDKAKKPKKAKTYKIESLADVQTNTVIAGGWHKAKIASVEAGEGDAGDYFKWSMEITEGKSKGKTPKPYFTSLSKKSLWNFKALLEACGFDIPKKDFDFDPNALIGEELFILVDHEDYEGRPQNVITMVAAEQPDGDDDESEDDDEDEEDEDKSDDDDESEEDEDDEDEDEDEVDLSEDEVMKMTGEELDDVITDKKLKVKLGEYGTLKKQRAAVVKALKKKGII